MVKEIIDNNEKAQAGSKELKVLRQYFSQCFTVEGDFDIEKFRAALPSGTSISRIVTIRLDRINSSSLVFKDNNIVQRVGDAEIDLGAIAKGYYLDKVKDYFVSKEYTKYFLTDIWIRPTITYGLVACFIKGRKAASETNHQ